MKQKFQLEIKQQNQLFIVENIKMEITCRVTDPPKFIMPLACLVV